MRTFVISVFFFTVWISYTSAAVPPSGLVTDRTTINNLLGTTAQTEGFENIALPPSGLLELGENVNSSTVFFGHGPGLVIPGVTFTTQTDIQIYSPTFSGGESQRLGYSSGSPFIFTFSPPVRAVGIDLFSLNGNAGFPGVEVLNGAGQNIGEFNLAVSSSKISPTFLGYQSSQGISKIFVDTFIGGPSFDNVEFGTGAVPEPSSLSLVILAVSTTSSCRRRPSTHNRV